METLLIIGKIGLCVLSVVITALVLLQKPKEEGVSGAVFGQTGSSGNAYSAKLKSKNRESRLSLWTKITIGLFFVFTIGMLVLQSLS